MNKNDGKILLIQYNEDIPPVLLWEYDTEMLYINSEIFDQEEMERLVKETEPEELCCVEKNGIIYAEYDQLWNLIKDYKELADLAFRIKTIFDVNVKPRIDSGCDMHNEVIKTKDIGEA